MKKRIAAEPVLRTLVLCLLALVFTGFLVLDMFFPVLGWVSAKLKYSGMLLVMALAVLAVSEKRSRDGMLVVAALCFTLAADFLLLFTTYYPAGVAVFCGAQLCYILRYRKKIFLPMLCLSLVGGVAAVVLWHRGLPFVYGISALYAVLILTATACAWRSALPRVNKLLAGVGMLCFVRCDIHVAVFNMAPDYQMRRYAVLLIWLFYLPAQMLIALSAGNYPAGED